MKKIKNDTSNTKMTFILTLLLSSLYLQSLSGATEPAAPHSHQHHPHSGAPGSHKGRKVRLHGKTTGGLMSDKMGNIPAKK